MYYAGTTLFTQSLCGCGNLDLNIENMSENETTETVANTESVATEAVQPAKSGLGKIVAAVVLVAVILLGILYVLEKEGRSSTAIFSSMIEKQRAAEVVATVNGEEITNADLDVSIKQFEQLALAQGVDTSSPEIQAEVRAQALEVLINTTLLRQAAAEKGIAITDEEVAARIETITTDIGGSEALTARMQELQLEAGQMQDDIKDELMIQALLEAVFAEASVEVTDEEVKELYDNAKAQAGADTTDFPTLEAVKAQVEQQIQSSKEQAAIDEYLAELKAAADISVETEAKAAEGDVAGE